MAVSVYPTGTTIYDPKRCWNGFNILSTMGPDTHLIDMNGRVVNTWKGIGGFPNKFLPGGYLMGSTGMRNKKYGYQDQVDLVQVDWQGNIVWKFDHHELISDPGDKPQWMARQHHDYQREGNPVGYYVPGMEPLQTGGTTLMLCHKNVFNQAISNKSLLDDAIIEVSWDGKIIWEWKCSEHFDEIGFSKSAKRSLARSPNMLKVGDGFGDWMHLNSVSRLGPNRWSDAGDDRFHPENLVWSSRQSNVLAIIDKRTGKIVWKTGPDYGRTGALRRLGNIIGPHHVHLVPKGLPGEGNVLVFDNGGWAGYGTPNPGSRTGVNYANRASSRVIELDPTSLEIVWQYTAKEAGHVVPIFEHRFYSSLVSSAQRLPNANTLITEGVDGRVFEITRDHEIVWEYVNPNPGEHGSLVYRSYRVPYEWAPQAERRDERPIPRLDVTKLRVPESGTEAMKVAEGPAASTPGADAQFCVVPAEAGEN